MEDIHDKYKHFDWYPTFIVTFINSTKRSYFSSAGTIVNSFNWSDTIQGYDYWSRINSSLINTGHRLSISEIDILEREALEFYRPLYEQYKLTHPELFI